MSLRFFLCFSVSWCTRGLRRTFLFKILIALFTELCDTLTCLAICLWVGGLSFEVTRSIFLSTAWVSTFRRLLLGGGVGPSAKACRFLPLFFNTLVIPFFETECPQLLRCLIIWLYEYFSLESVLIVLSTSGVSGRGILQVWQRWWGRFQTLITRWPFVMKAPDMFYMKARILNFKSTSSSPTFVRFPNHGEINFLPLVFQHFPKPRNCARASSEGLYFQISEAEKFHWTGIRWFDYDFTIGNDFYPKTIF